jgi:hypothetical protein
MLVGQPAVRESLWVVAREGIMTMPASIYHVAFIAANYFAFDTLLYNLTRFEN